MTQVRPSLMKLALTRHSGGFFFVIAAMWYAGASQANGAAYVLFFMLLSVVLVSIPQTYANLRALKVTPASIKPAFAGQEISLALEIVNPSRRARHTVSVDLPGIAAAVEVVDEIPGEKAAWAEVHFPAGKRGVHEVAVARISSAWPIGAFKVRRRMPMAQQYIVYPKPAGDPHLPATETSSAQQREGVQLEGDDFTGVRSYLPGESQRHVDWKAVARGQAMMTKQFAAESNGTLHFDFSKMAAQSVEARLSQLALWIVEAERTRRRYSLRLPSTEIPASVGETHYHKCLQALALHS